MNQKYNLYDFLSGQIEIDAQTITFDRIDIPMLQRDYAQGQLQNKKKKEDPDKIIDTGARFMDNLFSKLIETSPKEYEIDFIYGTVNNKDNSHAFEPLDGQQRLTTLFLLYWFLSSKEKKGDELVTIRKRLSKFGYETRHSSRLFCKGLCSLDTKYDGSKIPSKYITDQSWFFNSYLHDPTVKAMINMLDYIYIKYNSIENLDHSLYDRLQYIRFYPYLLNQFNLTEELYIKMNARGKQLTDFENFKADLLDWLKAIPNMLNPVDFGGQLLPHYKAFALKIDTKWTDLLWKFTSASKQTSPVVISDSECIVDSYFMRFIYRYLHISSILTYPNLSEGHFSKHPIVGYFYGPDGNDSIIKYNSNDFNNYFRPVLTENLINNIESILDILLVHWEDVQASINPSWEMDKTWNIVSERSGYQRRLAFWATCKYILFVGDKFDKNKFTDWMRFVWNIIIDPTIRDVPAMVRAIRFIENQSAYCEDILSYLTSESASSTVFETQFNHEKEKADLIKLGETNGIEWKSAINSAESLSILKGDIRCLTYNITDYPSFVDNIKKVQLITGVLSDPQVKDKINTDKLIKHKKGEVFKNIEVEYEYLWIHAILACVNEPVNFEKDKLLLSDGKYLNWRKIINEERYFLKAFNRLLNLVTLSKEPVYQQLEKIAAQKPNIQLQWIQMLNYKDEIGRSILEYHSFRRLLQNSGKAQYLHLSVDPNNEYDILLNGHRHEIISELIDRGYHLITRVEPMHGTLYGIPITIFRGRQIILAKDDQTITLDEKEPFEQIESISQECDQLILKSAEGPSL